MAAIRGIIRNVQEFVEALTKYRIDEPIDGVLENAMVAEHEMRLLFGAGHRIQDRCLGLLDVFSLHPAARRTRARHANPGSQDYDKNYILPLTPLQRREDLMPSTVFNIEAFRSQWDIFTHGALSEMRSRDWENVVVAGGAVLACLLPHKFCTTERSLNSLFQSEKWATSDIDLFLFGLSPEQAEAKMQRIYKAVCASNKNWKVVCVRRATTVSIHTTYPARPIQIILRLYQSPAEILSGFDVDACCFLYDGHAVWGSPRALAAIVRQCNTIDITRRSPSYESRLAKYAERGFEVKVPSLDRQRVKPSLYDSELQAFPNGLARLLVIEAAYNQPHLYKHLKYPKINNSTLPKSHYDNDLKWAKIPYGPIWDADRIEAVITRKETQMNGNPPNEGQRQGSFHRHIFFVGTMKHCLRPVCEDCSHSNEQGSSSQDQSECHIRGRIRFMTTNPGRQLMTGSFNPIDIGDWEEDAYLPSQWAANIRRVIFLDIESDESDGDSNYTDAVSELHS